MRIRGKLNKDNLLRHSAMLFASMMAVHVCNLVFQMAVGRVLPDEEYALLAAFLGILTIIQRPLSTLRMTVCHYSSLLEQEGRRGDVKRLLRKWLTLTAIPSILAGLGAIVLSAPLAGFFHLERSAPIIIAGALLPALCWMPILNGAAHGLQMFKWTATADIVGAIVRVGFGAGFIWFLYRACGWAMLGHGLGIYSSAGVIFIALWLALHGRETGSSPLPSLRLYLFQSFFVLASYAVLMTSDVVLVKHYLPDDLEFAKAATIGRFVVFLPGAIIIAMFPKVASRKTLTQQQKAMFFKAFCYVAVFAAAAVVGCLLLPGLPARILFGIKDASGYMKGMIGAMSVVMALNALLNVTMQFLLAQRRFKSCIAVIVSAVFFLVLTKYFHSNAWQIVLIAGACNAFALIVGLTGVLRAKVEE